MPAGYRCYPSLLVLLFFSALILIHSRYLFNKSISKSIDKYIIPYLDSKNLEMVKIEKLPYQFMPFIKKVGDFENVIQTPLSDTKYNRKIYFYLHYKDTSGNILRTTVKVFNDFFMNPIKIEFYHNI